MQTYQLDTPALLNQAMQRIMRKKEIKTALNKNAITREQTLQCLKQAYRCLNELCKPVAVVLPISANLFSLDNHFVLLAGETRIKSVRMSRHLSCNAAQAYLYLFSCGYDSREAFCWLQQDYSAYHFQDMLSNELLFAIGRQLHRGIKQLNPNKNCYRYPIQTDQQSNEIANVTWDAEKTRSLLKLFNAYDLGITCNPKGCFTPLHSILGVMMTTPKGPALKKAC